VVVVGTSVTINANHSSDWSVEATIFALTLVLCTLVFVIAQLTIIHHTATIVVLTITDFHGGARC
jgi:hypothetical protein